MGFASEWVGGQCDAARVGGHRPGQLDPGAPQGTQALQRTHGRFARVLGRTQQGHDARHRILGGAVLAQQGGERLAWANLDKDGGIALVQLCLDGPAELNGGAHLAGPVLRVGGLVVLQQGAADARVHRDRRGIQRGVAERLCHARQGTVHADAVESVGHLQACRADVLGFQSGGKGRDGVKRATHHGERGRVGGGDLHARRHQAAHQVRAGAHGQHGAGGLVEHGLTACDDGVHGMVHRQHARVAGGGVLANAVANHGIGPDAQAVQPSGQSM